MTTQLRFPRFDVSRALRTLPTRTKFGVAVATVAIVAGSAVSLQAGRGEGDAAGASSVVSGVNVDSPTGDPDSPMSSSAPAADEPTVTISTSTTPLDVASTSEPSSGDESLPAANPPAVEDVDRAEIGVGDEVDDDLFTPRATPDLERVDHDYHLPDSPQYQVVGTSLDPVHAAPEACVELLPGRVFVASPTPLVLDDGEMNGVITLTNCSAFTTTYEITAPDSATVVATVAFGGGPNGLVPFESREFALTIDDSGVGPGAIEFEIGFVPYNFDMPGPATVVDVYAFKTQLSDPHPLVADVGFSPGAASMGCGGVCITGAWLTTSRTSPDVVLNVRTNTPTQLEAWVTATSNTGGTWLQTGQTPTVSTQNQYPTTWDVPLTSLLQGQEYKIVLRATDIQGRVAEISDTFTTITIVDEYQVPVPDPGCAYQCIVEAAISHGDEYWHVNLHMETSAPARMSFTYGTAPIEWDNGRPSIADPNLWESGDKFITEWDATPSGLVGDTTYNVFATAVDVDGHTSYHAGNFHTGDRPAEYVLATFERIILDHNGEKDDWLKGELTFEFGIDRERLARSDEMRWRAGHQYDIQNDLDGLGRDRGAYWVEFGGDERIEFDVMGSERDYRAGIGFCGAVQSPSFTELGYEECSNSKVNPAFDKFSLADIDEMVPCSAFNLETGDADDVCVAFGTIDPGDDDYPRYRVVMSFHRATEADY